MDNKTKLHYDSQICEIYKNIQDKDNLNNYDLCKIFEYYSCIMLSEEYNDTFYMYNDIKPSIKEKHGLTYSDTGIDACNLTDTIAQFKLRSKTLTWKECSTFFGSQNIYNKLLDQTVIKWKHLILVRNKDSTLSKNLKLREDLFIDIKYEISNMIVYCNKLMKNQPNIEEKKEEFKLRDYQKESIKLIQKNDENVVISLPTGTGKNAVIIYSFKPNCKYLILVPRIILTEQLNDEILKHKPEYKNDIQIVGDNHSEYNKNISITLCVYNSINVMKGNFKIFDKIYIDEAHHIKKPKIYQLDDQDDSDDEEEHKTKYIDVIKSLSKYNNNVYLSATIDKINGFLYYGKDIREMIDKQYLCDYVIHVPIFSSDPNNRQVCEHLINKYTNIIIYCSTRAEGKKVTKLLNKLKEDCAAFIDCATRRNKRNDIIDKYNKGIILYLVNVRILTEGFNAPITKGVCFMHIPDSKATIIQIIGRALRLHPLKSYAHVILPFSDTDDSIHINKFLKIIAKNDYVIEKYYNNRSVGNYLSIEVVDDDDDEEEDDIKDVEFKYNLIYDNLGKVKKDNSDDKTFDSVKIDDNNSDNKTFDSIKIKNNNLDNKTVNYIKIDNEYGYDMYGTYKIIKMNKNGYINATKLCQEYGNKVFKSWKRNKETELFIEKISKLLNLNKNKLITIIRHGTNKELSGSYVHPMLINDIFSWVNVDFKTQIAKINPTMFSIC
jgi:hypothetical protein